ncbi:MAG: hypothetical protein EXS30_00110 [Pedosphaera sp.]|nr:hypothetical protein [Pedosphaera sp.]
MLTRRYKAISVVFLTVILAGWLVYQFGPFQAVFAVSNLSDPTKLATLGERAANPRLNKIVHWLHEADRKGMSPEITIRIAQLINRTKEPRASLVKESLIRNVKIADLLGLFVPENEVRLRNGKAGVITRGRYAASHMEIDHIVPYSLAPEAGNELANLEMMPQHLNREKSNRVGRRQLAHAEKLYAAGLITRESLAKTKNKAISIK